MPYTKFKEDPAIKIYEDIFGSSLINFVPNMLTLMFLADAIIFDFDGFDIRNATTNPQEMEKFDW